MIDESVQCVRGPCVSTAKLIYSVITASIMLSEDAFSLRLKVMLDDVSCLRGVTFSGVWAQVSGGVWRGAEGLIVAPGVVRGTALNLAPTAKKKSVFFPVMWNKVSLIIYRINFVQMLLQMNYAHYDTISENNLVAIDLRCMLATLAM